MKRIVCILLAAISLSGCNQQDPALRQRIEDLIGDSPAEVGVAMINGKDTVCVNSDAQYPLFSVVKFHQALAVCDMLRNDDFFLSYETSPFEIKVSPEDLKPDTWSPMREKYPEGGYFSVQALMEWSLVESDNNACDILFSNIAAPNEVNDYIHGLGVKDCNIAWTEEEQRGDLSRCYENWTTPLAAAELLGEFYEHRDADKLSRFLWETMAGCNTGTARIPKYIADKAALIVHKTGTGGPLASGGIMAINDIACVVLPDGSHFELAVLIKDAACEAAACEELIAKIAEACYDDLCR